MRKHMLAWLLVALISLLLLNGCSKNPPPPDFNQFGAIAIAPFATTKDNEMTMRFAIDLGEKLKLKFKDSADIKWIYDQSETLNPIGKKLNENNASPNDIFTDPKLAARIGKALGADIIIIGFVEKPKLKLDDSDKQYIKAGGASMAGSKRYTLWKQRANTDVKLKIVDTKSGGVIWNGKVKGYTKYIKAFQAQTPERNPVSDNIILAQLRDHIVVRIAHTLFPNDFRNREIPEIMQKPSITLMDSGGIVQYK